MPPTTPPPDEPSQGGWSDPGEPAVGGEGVGDAGAADAPANPAPSARYAVGALLGRGGMGSVYAARDTTLGRDVALKELQPELAANPGASARLAREAAITSRLDHPGIVSVHDGGRLPDGRPFYTMRLVRGRTLARAAAEATSPEARRQLVRHVLAAADAVAAAHDAGIVHRDLKPANILIGAHGETQVVDWGLATPTPAAMERWADLPAGGTHHAVGTPPYMAPEQARGEPPDARHDVWSLGVTLAGVVGGVVGGAAPGTPGDLPPELAAIVARATAPSPDDRYPHAAGFADDLLRWYEGRRVAAYSYTPGELLRRTLAAYRLPLGIGAVGLLALSLVVAGGWWQTTRSLDRALDAEAGARAALADLRLEQAVAATHAGRREAAERLALAVLHEREDPLARGVFAAFGRSERPALVREEAGPECVWSALPTSPPGEPGAGWVLCGGASAVVRWEGGRAAWTAPVVATGGEVRGDTVLLSDAAGTTTALDAATGNERGRWPIGSTDWVPQLPPRVLWSGGTAFLGADAPPSGCRGGIQLAAVSERGRFATFCSDGTLLLGTADDPAHVRVATEVAGDHVAMSLAWTPDGRLVAGTLRGRVYVLDGETGLVLATGPTELGSIRTLRVSPDGRHVALGGALGGVGLWRLDTSSLVGEIPADRPRAFTFADGALRVHEGRARGDDHPGQAARLRTWRLPGGAPSVVRGSGGLADIATSPDGTRVATAGGDGTIVTVGLRDGRTSRATLGSRVVKSVAFEPESMVASSSRNPTGAGALAPLDPVAILVAGMASPFVVIDDGRGAAVAVPRGRALRRIAWRPDGSIVGTDLQAGLYLWADRAASPIILAADRLFVDLERDGDVVVVVDTEGHVDRLDGSTFTALTIEPAARAVARRGERLAIATPDAVEIRDGPEGSRGVRHLAAPGESLLDVALSPDGARVAASSLDGGIHVWDAATGLLLGLLPGHTERAVAIEFLPDGDLVSASWDKSARVWALGALQRPVDALAAEVETAWGRAPVSPHPR
ncbi:MAG: protein kinase [Pseudomonadota bacterium]|nr:protein kinase [Pseudomonadota bacterium]